MKNHHPLFFGVTLGLALLVTGCESNGLSARIQEKSGVYATLKPWQKKSIDRGVVALGFTPDMVYMAVGNPSTKQVVGEGGQLWIYKNYFPSPAAGNVRYTLNTASNGSNTAGSVRTEANSHGGQQAAGAAIGGSAPSAPTTGAPQGASNEPADVTSYTLWITFQNGAVSKVKADEN